VFRNPARARTKSILFSSLKYTLPPHPHTPKPYSFCAPLRRTVAAQHFTIIRSILLLLSRFTPSHLASALTFLFLALFGLRQLGCASDI
jgi:hypothetical protein